MKILVFFAYTLCFWATLASSNDITPELREEFTDHIDYILELASDELKELDPIWMDFRDSLAERIGQTPKKVFRPRPRPLNHPRGCASDLQQLQRNAPEKAKRREPISRPHHDNLSNKEELKAKRAEKARALGKKQRSKGKFPDYDEIEPTRKESGTVAAVPLRIIRNGELRIKKNRGFYAGAIPVRVAPINLITDEESQERSSVRLILKGRLKFNFFEETDQLEAEIYLGHFVTAKEFDIVTKTSRGEGKSRKVPEALRLKIQDELEENFLADYIRSDVSRILRDVLREENKRGVFYFK